MSCWDPIAAGVPMPPEVLEDLVPCLLKAYEFHVPRASRRRDYAVERHARLLLSCIHTEGEMDRLCWGVSAAVMCGEVPYPPPQYSVWKHDYFVMEALVMLVQENMEKSGPVYYSRDASELLFSMLWSTHYRGGC